MEKPGRGGGKKKAAAAAKHNDPKSAEPPKGKKPAAATGPKWEVSRILNNGRRFRVGNRTLQRNLTDRTYVISCAGFVLAGDLPKHYTYCPIEYLDWTYRSRNLIREIEEMNADIVCLQETDHFKDHWSTELGKRGYDSAYKQRTGGKEDGCATFWKRNKFVMRSRVEVEYNSLAKDRPVEDEKRYTTNSIALLVVLDCIQAGSNDAVLLANTHIWWNTKSADVQLAQTECALKAIADVHATEGALPTILCGDFNSILSTPPIKAALQWNNGALHSAYSPLDLELELPFTPDNVKLIDFLFYSHSTLEVVQLLEFPPEDKLKAFEGCPNRRFSSDHLALLAHFLFRSSASAPATAPP